MTIADRARGTRFAIGLLLAAAGGLALATLAGFAGRLGWLLDLAAHFRLQYVIGGAFLAVAFGALRRPRIAGACLILVAINAALVVPQLGRTGVLDTDGGPVFRMLVTNVHRAYGDSRAVGALIERESPDVVVLMEVDTGWLERLDLDASYPFAVRRPRTDNFGIAVYSRLPLAGSVERFGRPDGPPSIAVDVHGPGGVLHLVATHPVPPTSPARASSRDVQLAAIGSYVGAHSGPVVVAGDLNATPWSHAYRRLCRESGLLRARSPWLGSTYPGFGWAPLRLPIDHVLHTPELRAAMLVGPYVGSDHRPLIAEVAWNEVALVAGRPVADVH